MSFLLWLVAFIAALLCLIASAVVGRTLLTESLFGIALAAGVIGIGVDRLKALAR